MEFQVLGPLRVMHDGGEAILPTAYKLRLTLAVLLTMSDQRVSTDALVAAIWGDQAPPSARRNVQQYIHMLRTVVGTERLVSQPGGYTLSVGDSLDATRFRGLAQAGRASLVEGDPELASKTLRAALDTWRGIAYEEFRDCATTAEETDRLERLRLEVFEWWMETELVLGRHREVLAELTDVARAYPYRESLQEYLLIALHRNGRRADALEAFRQTRALLADDLGIEPGRTLQQLHQDILRGDTPAIPTGLIRSTVTVSESVTSILSETPRELPADVAGFVGRHDELRALDELVLPESDGGAAPMAVCAITGTAGVGKTALAVRWGHRVAGEFPDGQLYLDLQGYAVGRPLRPIEALATLMGSLGATPDQVPVDVAAAAARYRSLAAGRRLLLVLDNAASAEQVRPLLPGSPSCLVLVTSRNRLTGLVARDGARRLTLDVLTLKESMELLDQVLGSHRTVSEPERAAELGELCARLPLALRIAAARLADQPNRKLGDYVAELDAADDAIAAMAIDGDDDSAVRVAFDLSYRTMPEPARLMFRRLGLVPCPDFSVTAAATLAGTSQKEALAALDRLAAAHLVVQHGPGRFTLHDLLRHYAASLAALEDSESERVEARRRLYGWFLAMSIAAADLAYPEAVRLPRPVDVPNAMHELTGIGPALEWLQAERSNLVIAVRDAAQHGPQRMAWLCADALRAHFDHQRSLTDWLTTSRAALAAAHAQRDPLALASAFHSLAHAHYCQGHYNRSIAYLRRTIALAAESEWSAGEAAAYHNLGIMLHQQGRTTEAMQSLHHALRINRTIDRRAGQAKASDTLALIYKEHGRLRTGVKLALQARDLYRQLDARRPEAGVDVTLGELYHQLGELDKARELIASGLKVEREFGRRSGEASGWASLARIHCDARRTDEATEAARLAVALADEIGEPRAQANALNALAFTRAALADYDHAIQLHDAALAISEEIGVPFFICDAGLGSAAAYSARRDYDTALHQAERSLTIAEQAQLNVMKGRALTALALAHHGRGATIRALDSATKALRNHKRTGYRIGHAETHLVLAQVHLHNGQESLASHHRQLARALYTEIGVPLLPQPDS